MAARSNILGWETPRIEGPGGLQSTGSQRARHDWAHVSPASGACYSGSDLHASPSHLPCFLSPLWPTLLLSGTCHQHLSHPSLFQSHFYFGRPFSAKHPASSSLLILANLAHRPSLAGVSSSRHKSTPPPHLLQRRQHLKFEEMWTKKKRKLRI